MITALYLAMGILSPAFAAPIYGVIIHSSAKYFILQETQKFEIVTTSSESSRDIKRLSTGDFVALEGYYNLSERKVFVTSVDWVGLKKIIGAWITSDEKVIEFQDYTTLLLHNYEKDKFPINHKVSHRPRPVEPVYLSYRMAPGNGNTWTLFLSEARKLYLARLNLTGTNLVISFYDNNSGKVIKTLNLTRLYLDFKSGEYSPDEYF